MKRTNLILLALATGLIACDGSDPAPEEPIEMVFSPLSRKINPTDSRVSPAGSCDAFREYVIRASARSALENQVQFILDGPAVDLAAPTLEVSRTNLQEDSVDEADIVKADSDGNIYALHDNSLIIIDAFPAAQMQERSRLEFEHDQRQFLLFEEQKRGIVFSGSLPPPMFDPTVDSFAFYQAGSYLSFIDLSDLDAPVVTGRVWVRGFNLAQRSIDDRAFVMFQSYIEYARDLLNSTELQTLRGAYQDAVNAGNTAIVQDILSDARDIVRPSVLATPLEDLLPAAYRSVGDSFEPIALLECSNVYFPRIDVEVGLSTLVSLSADGAEFSATTVLASASDVYVSPQSAYITQSSRSWWWDPNQADETAIHQFSLSGAAPTYVASGLVDGSIVNRFALSEFDGHLRIATTQNLWDATTQMPSVTNHLFVLKDDDGGNLNETGSVRDFELNETIQSVRFVGAKGYVVTFELIDPLFTFDLADPFSPQQLGELEIPGFSTYMHPYDDNHILTIGRGEQTDVFTRPIRAQLFDVSVLDDPRLVHVYDVEFEEIANSDYQWSPALFDSRAFTFVAGERLMTIPVSISGSFLPNVFDGFLALDVDPQNGFSERSRVDHDDLVAAIDCLSPQFADHDYCQNGNFVGAPTARRSIVILNDDEKILYSMSRIGIKATPVDDGATTLGFVIF